MTNVPTTPVPNTVFDLFMKDLKIAELKVLLVIIRQTLGWRKNRDWISGKQMMEKTGCSNRSVNLAIDFLVKKKLIAVCDDRGNFLWDPSQRRGKPRMYFRLCEKPSPVYKERKNHEQQGITNPSCEKNADDLRKLSRQLAKNFRITNNISTN